MTASFVVLLMFLGIVLTADDMFLALKKATNINFTEKSNQENAARILKWNLQKCPKIIYTGSEYGEATVTIKCSNGKAYLLSHSSTHSDFLDVYDWNIDEIDFNTLKYNLGNSFEEWCLQRTGLSAEARKTVEVLLEEAGTSDCKLAANNVSSRTELYLSGKEITDLRPLGGLTNLKTLRLHNNQITDVNPLSGLTNLEKLYISSNPLADIRPLSGLTNLTELDLNDNQIEDVSPLSELTTLKDLRLNNNQITDISPLARLTNLWVLYLSYNQITDISPLARLKNLRLVNLTGNPITHRNCPVFPPEICDFDTSPWVP
ncbi:MAG: leucine-rich repeat domain-containing protein [Coleofasciculus sp. B1-GNL1-01]|uniref:leucine-rich repeat domain-containing protein n=1 Tax=Coleofasciculus sp. B1-GNL1-01 TaxID=3068484 RepID=UPI0032F8A1CD